MKRWDSTVYSRSNESISVSDALEKVMLVYETEGYREKTVRSYRSYYEEFIEIVRRENVSDITKDDARRYIKFLLDKRGLSPVTVNIRLASLRSVFNRMVSENILEESPLDSVKKLRTDEGKVFSLTDNQVTRLFNAVDTDTFAGYRDYVAMLVMLKSGLRSNEVNSLDIIDLDLDNRVMMLPGAKNKNRKSRSVPMTVQVAQEVRNLIAEEREYFGPDIQKVFVSQFGQQLRDDHLRKRLDKYARKAGLKGECRASPHSLRHTFAVRFLSSGGDLKSLQSILGHSDLASTEVYVKYTDERVKENFDKVTAKDTKRL
ncbi:tyrosine-type recombinase/integrase [Halobacillus sp. GSS1]|nr:tyrosine-type recombinase/integrase [Halobacillus sp. GSS1]